MAVLLTYAYWSDFMLAHVCMAIRVNDARAGRKVSRQEDRQADAPVACREVGVCAVAARGQNWAHQQSLPQHPLTIGIPGDDG